MVRPTVFIHTNEKQKIGALVSAYSMRRNSARGDTFDVRLIEAEERREFFAPYEGRTYLRDGDTRRWLNDDLQSFTPLRFLPPELMGYEGRAVVVDPDVFAVGDICDLLGRDMQGKAVVGRWTGSGRLRRFASSVMLLDCGQLRHWRFEEDFERLFRRERDYKVWVGLGYEDPATIGHFEPVWNDFDRLTPETRLLHNTRKETQPWKVGLPADFIPAERSRIPGAGWLQRTRRKLFGEYALVGAYRPHPDPNQERLFFGLLKECLDAGLVTSEMLKSAIARDHIRHDALEVIERTPALEKGAHDDVVAAR